MIRRESLFLALFVIILTFCFFVNTTDAHLDLQQDQELLTSVLLKIKESGRVLWERVEKYSEEQCNRDAQEAAKAAAQKEEAERQRSMNQQRYTTPYSPRFGEGFSQFSTAFGSKFPLPPIFHGHDIIITLTTIPDRMPYLNTTLLSLMLQTVPATEIVLNIPYTSRRFANPDGTPFEYDLPVNFIEFVNSLGDVKKHPELAQLSRIPKITIQRCDDDGPATKLLPTLAREFDLNRLDSILLIADDDLLYFPSWVENIVGYYLTHKELHYSALGYRGYPLVPGNIWEWRIISQIALGASQIYNLTRAMNSPYNPTYLDDSPELTPNAHRFIFRRYNYTIVRQEKIERVKKSASESYSYWSNDPDAEEPPEYRSVVELNPDWEFAHLFVTTHPLYRSNPWHSPNHNVHETIRDIEYFIRTELGYGYNHAQSRLKTPQWASYETIDPRYQSHSPVDIITGNNGFLMRPYYFLRYNPFLGNMTRVKLDRYEVGTFQHYQDKYKEYMYILNNEAHTKLKQINNEEYKKVSSLFDIETDADDKTPQTDNSPSNNPPKTPKPREEDLILGQYGKKIKELMKFGAKIAEERTAELIDNLTISEKDKEQNRVKRDHQIWNKHNNFDKDNQVHDHPELSKYEVGSREYNDAHILLHKKEDYIQQQIDEQKQRIYQRSLDIIHQHTSTWVDLNIVNFGKFEQDVEKLKLQLQNDPEIDAIVAQQVAQQGMGYGGTSDESTDVNSILGNNGKPLPDSVWYMDDIFFNGILAANNVSRFVISSPVDPIHRPKMQAETTTLEQVPIGRAYHNNVLLKAFEKHWSNPPYLIPNLKIPDYYLHYYAWSRKAPADEQEDALAKAVQKKVKKWKNEDDDILEDPRNNFLHPWEGWNINVDETNVNTGPFTHLTDEQLKMKEKQKENDKEPKQEEENNTKHNNGNPPPGAGLHPGTHSSSSSGRSNSPKVTPPEASHKDGDEVNAKNIADFFRKQAEKIKSREV